jgi:N-acetylglutamate synthase-like GNAT family acetyltransferase
MIKFAESKNELDQLDELLWQVLWEPLNLRRNIRTEFSLPGETIQLIALDEKVVVGGLVANWTNLEQVEIRHLAVTQSHQCKAIGTNLISKLFELIKKDKPVRIQVHARNKSYNFFTKTGFESIDNRWIEHPDFEKYGIRFKLVEKVVE